jgi:diguanylate cyclase (GGDEF)-like protein/putative nucleotidyltransferase with HDIG domain
MPVALGKDYRNGAGASCGIYNIGIRALEASVECRMHYGARLRMLAIGKNARIWAAVYTVVGILGCALNLAHVQANDPWRFLWYLICANVAALGIKMIGTQSLIPAGFLIMLLGVGELSLPELLFIGCTATVLRDIRKVRGMSQMLPFLFGMASVTIGIAAAHGAYKLTSSLGFNALFPVPVVASSFVLLFNYGLATTLLSDSRAPLIGVYRRECRHLLPWFVAASYLAYLVRCATLQTGWQPGVIALPILFVLDYGYRTWSKAQSEHKEELAALHRRTLEILAVAIEAKDHTTQLHLRRVQTYAVEVGKELKLNETELEGLNVAALLHDIGKLAIPDHILVKPGPLSPEEWEKMKTHPVIGAEMLTRMRFPDSVAPIVKTHHEKWDGTGYPGGLSRESIPIGARILAAVDFVDALASDRPYRRAVPLQEVMKRLSAERGKSFDPRIVDVLEKRYAELEQMAWAAAKNGTAEDTASEPVPEGAPQDLKQLAARLSVHSHPSAAAVFAPIASARLESQLLQELTNDVGRASTIEEVFSSIHKCLTLMIQYDTLVAYVVRGENLEPIYVHGKHGHLFSQEEFGMGQGPSGWVAQNHAPIVNGNPSVEGSYKKDSGVVYKLQSALAVPFEGRGGLTGVLTLYSGDRNFFNRDHLRILQSASLRVGLTIENVLRYQSAETSAVTDHLTGIPNARSLAAHLERELSRARRENATIGVLVSDLDGFKQINDRFGHLRGNEVLQQVAKGLQEACRDSDYLARMGGDEFVIVLPGLKEDVCAVHLERLRAVAVQAGWLTCGEDCLSMSIGAAIFPVDGNDGETLLAQADQRMYRAKNETKYGGSTAGPADPVPPMLAAAAE